MSVGAMKDQNLQMRNLHASHTPGEVYLQQIKKKAEAESKNCHAKTITPGASKFSFFLHTLPLCDCNVILSRGGVVLLGIFCSGAS
jgi:hypothetical protein